MKKHNYALFTLVGFAHCTAFSVITYLPDYVVPKSLETILLWASFLVGIVAFILFNFYKANSFKHIIIRMLVLLVCNMLCVDLLRNLEIQEVLKTLFSSKNIVDENYAGIFIIAMFLGVMFYTAVLGIVMFFVIKLYKKRVQGDGSAIP